MPTLRSFDIFDTVLTRMVGQPSSVFLLIGYEAVRLGMWSATPERFVEARTAAETQARRHAHPSEITLEGIYAQFAFNNELSTERVQKFAALEIEFEAAVLRGIPHAKAWVADAKQAGCTVAFISDMYLPAPTIRDWLTREGLARSEDPLWVSSETGATKASGAMFDHVRAQEARGGDWFHTGDHPTSDVSVPRSLGVRAELSAHCHLTRYEAEMERHTTASAGLSSLLAGASRWTRLSQPASGAAQTALRDIAAQVAGPVLSAFLYWVLLKAKQEGLRKIWFVARDGQVMLRMSKVIAARLGIDIDMGYLYSGRQVVHLAGLRRIDTQALKWLTGAAHTVTVAALLERVGLVQADVRDAMTLHGLPATGVIGWERMSAVEAFFRDEGVQAKILAMAAQRRLDMQAYYTACGLMGDDSCAVVDVGWRGSVLRSLFDILSPAHGARHHFMYFGLYARPADVPEARMSAFCFDVSASMPLGVAYDVPSLMAVMEIFCQADHDQIVHVDREANVFVPRLRKPPAGSPTLWDVPYFQDCLEAFARAVRIDLLPPGAAPDLRTLCERLLRALMTEPSATEALVLGSVQYVDDQSGTTSQPFARPYDLTDWRTIVRSGELPQKTLTWWAQGAWTLTTPRVRLFLRAVRKAARARLALKKRLQRR